MSHLKEKLGMPFLQLHDNFAPKDIDRVVAFVESWKYEVPLATEFRHTSWYNDPEFPASFTSYWKLTASRMFLSILQVVVI